MMYPAAAAASDQVALADERRLIRYAELGPLLAAEQAWLQQSGGSRFALLADNSCGWALTDLGLHQAGLLNVPLPGYFTPEQQQHIIADAGIDSLLTDQPERASQLAADFVAAGISPQTGLHLHRRRSATPPRPAPSGTIKVTYTSGSTAAPKGVCLSAPSLEAVATSLAEATADLGLTRHLCLLPLATLLENVGGIHAALRSGASCIIPALATTGMSYGGLDPRKLIATITAHAPSSLILVPELLRVLVTAAQKGWQPPASLRFIAVGGASVAPELLASAAQLGLPVFEGYGLSECGSVVCVNTATAQRRGSVGRPLPHVRVRLDGQQQITVSGPLMSGYLGDALTTDSPATEVATGDLGEIDADGFVYIRGRLKNLIITSLGRNISPEWVERELQIEPGIGMAVVCGEARPYLSALISPAGAAGSEQIAAAVARANARLPDYAQLRRWAVVDTPFTFANGLLTANGRPRRAHILQRYAAILASLYPLTTETEATAR
jgi:long-subunit acyl-CoA synthetase (AMP-forming)